MFLPIVLSATQTKHHSIYFNIFVIDDGIKYPLFETEKINKRLFSILADSDVELNKYKNNFKDTLKRLAYKNGYNS